MQSRVAITAGIMIAAALCLCGALQYSSAEPAYQQQSRDPYGIAAQAVRFAEFRAAVPASAILGYLTDVAADDVLATSMLFTAQYDLAPRLLQKSTSYNLVLGNFTRPDDFAAVGRRYGLRVERDFGNGVVLFRKEVHP